MLLQPAMYADQGSPHSRGTVRPRAVNRPRGVRFQSGQALTETLIFALVAVGVLFGTLLIGRLHAVQASAIGAARAHAFECRLETAGCDDPARSAQRVATIRARHFSGANQTVSSVGSGGTGMPPHTAAHPFWTNPDGSRMVTSLESVSVSAANLSLNAGINVAAAAERTQGMPSVVPLASLAERFGLDAAAGFRASSVTVPVHASLSGAGPTSNAAPLALQIRARLAIVGNDWNASQSVGPASDSVQSRVERGARLDAFREASLDAGYAIPRALLRAADAIGIEPGASALASHRLDMTVVPQDRRP